MALTETWLVANESDDFILSALTPPGYDIYNISRGSGYAHGGMIVLFKEGITVVQNQTTEIATLRAFEYRDIVLPVDQEMFYVRPIIISPSSILQKQA